MSYKMFNYKNTEHAEVTEVWFEISIIQDMQKVFLFSLIACTQ